MTRLDVVTGFLGAGKTTFIARYSHWLKKKGISFCIIENEFGCAGVDGAALSRQGYRVREISGGCVCCTLKVTLHDLLMELSGDVERIILEPSGIFSGDDLWDILNTEAVQKRVSPGIWTGILDPLGFPVMTEEERTVLRYELHAAGSLVISKTQFASREELLAIDELIASLYPQNPPVLWADAWSIYQDDEWFPALWEQGAVQREHERIVFDHAAMFQSASFFPASQWSEETLRKTFSRLLSGSAGAIARIKGNLNAPNGGSWLINCTPGCVRLDFDVQGHPVMLNVIGKELVRKEIRNILEDGNHE